MHTYYIKIVAHGKYRFDREYEIKASDFSVASRRGVEEFFKDKLNRKRKRHITNMIINIKIAYGKTTSN